MPKIVDPVQRRDLIADAVFAALREGGFGSVTLSAVAARAGLAIGSVRHFLGTHEHMLLFSFDVIVERIRERVTTRAGTLRADLEQDALDADGRRAAVADILCEFLPLDASRRDEAVVWIEFVTAARTDPRLAETSRGAAEQSTRLIEVVLTAAVHRGSLDPSLDLTVESARLAALIDGLTLRAALHPTLLDADLARRVVVAHLRQLAPGG